GGERTRRVRGRDGAGMSCSPGGGPPLVGGPAGGSLSGAGLRWPSRRRTAEVVGMAKWQLVSKHDFDWLSLVPIYTPPLLGGGALSAVGAGLLYLMSGGDNTLSGCLIGIPLLLGGLLVLAIPVLGLSGGRIRWVRVYDRGIRWCQRGKEYKYRWDEVT